MRIGKHTKPNYKRLAFAANRRWINIEAFELYWPGESPLHHLDPRVKVGGLAVLSLLISLTHWRGLVLTSLGILALIFISRTPLKCYRSLGLVLIGLGVFYGLAAGWVWPENRPFWMGYWSVQGLAQAGDMLWRIALIFGLTRLFAAVTMPLEQGLGITYFFNPLIRVTPKAADFALLLTLTLRFIPLLVEEATLLWKARMTKSEWPASMLLRSRDLIKLIPPLLLLSLRRAEELAENLTARGYATGQYRTLLFHTWAPSDRWGVIILGLWCGLIFVLK